MLLKYLILRERETSENSAAVNCNVAACDNGYK